MRSSIVFGCISCLALVAGCSPSSSGNGPQDGGVDASPEPDSGGSDGGSEAGTDAGSPDAGRDAAACNGSVVPASITTSTTLTAACSPWHLTGASEVGDPNDPTAAPVLTIEPGVTILADAGSVLQVGVSASNQGGIVAAGTSTAPIVLKSSAASPKAGDWEGLVLGDAVLASSQLSHVEIDDAGATNGGSVSASLVVGEGTTQALAITLSNLKLADDAGYGLLLDGRQVKFGAGSGNLTVSDWGSAFAPIALAAEQGDSLAGVSFSTGASGHDGQIVLVDTGVAGLQVVDRTQTWPAIPIPYLLQNAGIDVEQPGAGNGGGTTTLTIAGPNTIMFTNAADGNAGTGIYVDIPGVGGANLVANGVTFTTDVATNPTAGSWGGISFNMTTAGLANSSLTNCTFRYAGAATNWSTGQGCTGVVFIDDRSNNNASLAGPTITGCTFADYIGDAIFLGLPQSGGLTTTYTNNTFASATTGVCSCVGGTCQ